MDWGNYTINYQSDVNIFKSMKSFFENILFQ